VFDCLVWGVVRCYRGSDLSLGGFQLRVLGRIVDILDILGYFGGVLCGWRSVCGILGLRLSRIRSRIRSPRRRVGLIAGYRHCIRSPNHSRVI
jgi:hypothetical protein